MALARWCLLCHPWLFWMLDLALGTTISSMSGKKLRAIVGNFPPSIAVLRNSSGDVIGYSGLVYDHLVWVSRFLNFTFTAQPAKENSNGIKLANGTWSGIIGQIMRDEGDLACVPMAAVLQRHEAIEFASYIGGDRTGILVQYPTTYLSYFGLTMAFSLNVWIGWFVSFVAVVAGFYVIAYVKRLSGSPSSHLNQLSDIAIKAVAVLMTQVYQMCLFCVKQGTLFKPGNHSFTFIATVWAMAAFVFVNTYCSCLTSYMSLTYRRPEVNSFQDLAGQQKLKMATIKGSVGEIDILNAQHGALRALGDQLRSCDKDCRLTDIGSITDKVLRGESAGVLPITVCRGMMLQTMLGNKGKCRLTMAKETMAFQHMYLGLSKKSPYATELNRASFWWFDTGVQAYMKNHETFRTDRCILNYDSRGVSVEMPDRVRLKLEQFYVAFIILFSGYLLAFVQFIRERVIFANRTI